MLNVPRELLQDLIDDVADYVVSRTFKDRETTWRSDLLKRADELLARQPSAIDKQDAVGQWVHCSPSLLNAGVSCANTPRRACECHPENCGHDHFIAHAAAPSVEQDEPVVMIQGRFVLEADPDFPDLPTHSAWSEIPTKESADRLKAKYGDKIELRELVARSASTSANVAQLDMSLEARLTDAEADVKRLHAEKMELWNQVHGYSANVAQGAEAVVTVKVYETYTGQNGWTEVTQEEYDRTKDKYEHRIRRVPAPPAQTGNKRD